jgi:hypothetical protein
VTPHELALEIKPDASPERLHEIERRVHNFLWKYLTELAINIDDNAMHHRINYAHEAARMLRDKAHEHLNQT